LTHPLAFLLGPSTERVGIPEGVSEEERLLADTVRRFVREEALPRSRALDTEGTQVLLRLFEDASRLGITGLEVPARYGGLGVDLTGAMLLACELGAQPTLSSSLGAHFGLGTLPLALYAAEPLKQRYLPSLASGERIGAYALTEPDAGSDALSIRTRAERCDGGFLLNGRKQFITNAGIAGLYVVFAQVPGEGFTAFVVPAEAPGLEPGRPEEKMGLRGSPTASLSLTDVRIPADHVLGEVGRGHRVAFAVLNLGRLKLGFDSFGCARETLRESLSYAASRRQFGQALVDLGLIRAKLVEMAARAFLLEGVCVRTSRAIDAAVPGGPWVVDVGEASAVLKTHSVRCALVKIAGSECADFVVDEGVQIHGGYGFVEESAVCRTYRDTRVKRIFEGTNEINRLFVGERVLREGGLVSELRARGRGLEPEGEGVCAALRWGLGRFLALAKERNHDTAADQRSLAGIADLALEIYGLDTARARVAGLEEPGPLREALLVVAKAGARRRGLATLCLLASRIGDGGSAELAEPLLRGVLPERSAGETVARVLAEQGVW
jgi:alkylation response protein AidB-like acyl-CoA dehydrogenase